MFWTVGGQEHNRCADINAKQVFPPPSCPEPGLNSASGELIQHVHVATPGSSGFVKTDVLGFFLNIISSRMVVDFQIDETLNKLALVLSNMMDP